MTIIVTLLTNDILKKLSLLYSGIHIITYFEVYHILVALHDFSLRIAKFLIFERLIDFISTFLAVFI